MARELLEKKNIDIYGILFDFGKSEILQESDIIIEQIASILKENSDLKIKIVGHTDNVGSDEANLELSHGRASAVQQHLISKHGINQDRRIAIGKGESKPIDSDDNSDGRSKNRRVSIQAQ